MSQKHPLWVEISRFSFLARHRSVFFLTFDIRNPEISGFRFTKIDLSQPPGGVGSSYLESLEPFIHVLIIFDEKKIDDFFMKNFRSENSETRFWANFDMSKVSELVHINFN